MAVALPTDIAPQSVEPKLIDWGSDQSPALGGPMTRVTRLGSRHAIDVQMPPMNYTRAMAWVQRLKRGKTQRVIMEFPQPGLDLTGFGNGFATGAGTSVTITGQPALIEGQYFSVIVGGRRYLYSADAPGTSVTVTPMVRVPFTSAVVEIGTPMIEGVLMGDETAWSVNVARHVGLSFTIMEAE